MSSVVDVSCKISFLRLTSAKRDQAYDILFTIIWYFIVFK